MSISTNTLNDDLRQYLLDVSLREHPALALCREQTAGMSTAGMQISPEQGQFMAMMLRMLGAKRVLEVGVFTGYSSTVMALALPEDGQVVGIDTNKNWTARAKRIWAEAGVENKIQLILERADLALHDLVEAGEANQFDFVFIDADKKSYETYFELCLKLVRPGGVIALDNAFMGGQVLDEGFDDDNTVAVRALNQKLKSDPRVEVSFVPIGDGLYLAYKR